MFRYIETSYNSLRRHQTHGYLSPNQFEAAHATGKCGIIHCHAGIRKSWAIAADNNMSRIAVAFQSFFAALSSKEKAERLRAVLVEAPLPREIAGKPSPEATSQPPPPRSSGRSDAITLLAALQRESRLVDLVKQPLASFSDEEIGAAARNVLSDCRSVIDRFFQLEPVTDAQESSPCEVPRGYDPARYKLTGRVEGDGPFRGILVHHGWKATAVKLPEWIGSKDSAGVIAPAEVEI